MDWVEFSINKAANLVINCCIKAFYSRGIRVGGEAGEAWRMKGRREGGSVVPSDLLHNC